MRRLGAVASSTLLLSLVLWVSATPAASAHADLTGTWPAAGTTARSVVDHVVLQFDTSVVPQLTDVVVTAPDASVLRARTAVDGAVVTTTLRGPLTRPGRYRIAYRTVAADGHPVVGSVQFAVSPEAARDARRGRPATASTVPVPRGTGADRTGRRDVSWNIASAAVTGSALLACLGIGAARRSRDREATP